MDSDKCSRCEKTKIDLTKSMCEGCRNLRAEQARLRAKAKKSQGKCAVCGKQNDRFGYRCSECLGKFYDHLNKLCIGCNSRAPVKELQIITKKIGENSRLKEFEERPGSLCEECMLENKCNAWESKLEIIKEFGSSCYCCDLNDAHYLTIMPSFPMSQSDTYDWKKTLFGGNIQLWLRRAGNIFDKHYSENGEFKNTIFEDDIPLAEAKTKYKVVCYNCFHSLKDYNSCSHLKIN